MTHVNSNYMKKIILLLGLICTLCAFPLKSDIIDDWETVDDTMAPYTEVAEYLKVTLYGQGSVSFTAPSSITLSASGITKTVDVRIISRVPGIGPIVTLTVSKAARITTNDKQIFDLAAGEPCSFLLEDQYSPQMAITFR